MYDTIGRTTTQASGATIGYFANDLVRRQASGTSRQTWNLDAAGRLASWTTESQGTDGTWTQPESKTNNYGSDGDSPDWVQEAARRSPATSRAQTAVSTRSPVPPAARRSS
ncbi:hypothetical protein AB0M61_27535 [Streptomyces sp. NPDC051642]|uniref:hypothetical protein n=1 Tax=Streptomyces sp. NPDC051642 TaxID=3154646 RepID=UPI00344808A7